MRYIDLNSSLEAHITTLRSVIAILVIINFSLWYGWRDSNNDVRIHIPPDIRSGAILQADEISPPNVYTFAGYIFQQLNHWANNGDKDYGLQIFKTAPYLTPEFREYLINDLDIRDALVGQIDTSILTNFKTKVAKVTGKTQTEIENIAVKTLLSREKTNFDGLRNLSAYNDTSFANMLNSAAASIGVIKELATFYPAMYAMKTAAPIIQAAVLMMIYMLMPFYFVFSSYNIGKMIFMSIIIFSVKFWTVLWAASHWLDNNLMDAIKPSWYRLDLTQNNMVVEFIVDLVIAGLFVVMPLFWSGLLTWAGHRIGNQITGTVDKSVKPAMSAGFSGGKTGIDAGKGVMK